MRSSSRWSSPTDSAHSKWVAKALNSSVLRRLSPSDESNREASRHVCRSSFKAFNSFSWSSNEPQVRQSSGGYAAGRVENTASNPPQGSLNFRGFYSVLGNAAS